MSLLGYVLLLTAALCCTAAPAAPDDLKSCKKPDRRVEAELLGDWEAESYPENAEAVFQCRPGYTRLGSIKMICKSGKWQTYTKGQCKKKSCGHPGDIPFGSFQLSNEESFIFGAVVQYFCDDGYQMVSKETKRQCTASGWSNYLPHCEVRNCPPVDATDNINVISTSYDEEYSVGQVIRFECKDPKLKLNGPSEIFCTSEGKWNSEPPTCVVIRCTVPVIDHGSVQNSRKQVYSNNEVMQFTCKTGFQANRNGQSTCTKDDWIPKPSCEEILCSPYDPVVNGKLVGTETRYRFGDTIDVQCEEGYALQIEPNRRRECTANGWSPSTRCVSKKCDRPDIKHGIIYNDYHYYYPKEVGRYLEYYCESNYQPRGWTRISCTKTGWEPEPKCSRECSYRDAYFENAQLIDLKSVYVEGHKVQFRCTNNYQTPDGKNYGERTCLPNGKFTPAKCSVTCTAPRLHNGKFNQIKNQYEIGEFLQYECNKGYMTERRHLSGKSQCLEGRWHEAPQCIPITCQYNRQSFNDGDIIKYRCPSGQKPRSDIGQCYYYGWGPPLECQDIECSIPESSNLVLSPFDNSYKIRTKVSFSCKGRFVRSGSLESVCTEGGWNPLLPTCKEETIVQPQPTDQPSDGNKEQGQKPTDPPVDDNKKQVEIPTEPDSVAPDSKDEKEKRQKCPIAYSPQNAEIIDPKEEYYSNDIVTMKCARGYKMHGSPKVQCVEGKWEQPPECIRAIQCQNPQKIENGIIESSNQEIYATDDVVKYICRSGFHISGSDQSTCVNGHWSALPTCTEDACVEAPNIQHGTAIEKKTTFSHGERAKYKCDNGFRFKDVDAASCVEGQWMNIPVCISTSCKSLPKVLNSKLKGGTKSSYASGEKVTYECNSGYSLERSGEAQCDNTNWINIPVCRRTGEQCGPPPTVQYGDTVEIRKVGYRSGEKVEFRCPEYYILDGNRFVTCLNGVWNEAPVCIEPCTAKERDMERNNIQLKWRSDRKLYSRHGEPTEFVCRPGYEALPDTQMRITCDQGNLEYPKCFKRGIGEQCGPPPTVQYGDTVEIRKVGYRSGEKVEFRCPEYYILDGNNFVTCLNGVWNEAPVCIEPCTAKERDMASNNIQLKWRSDRKIYSRHGELIAFICRPGYEALPATQMRITCDQGNLEYPKCFKRGFCVLQQSTMLANNIHYNLSTVVDHGQTILFQCNDGMMAENKLEAKCEQRKINYPRCTAAKSCKTPEILNGFVKTEQQANYDSGSYVEFDCNEGYVINLAMKVKCENGQWSKLPVCYSPCKISSEDLTKHNIQLLSSNDQKTIPDKNYKHGTEISVVCMSGFRRSTNAALVLECYDGKFRYPRCFSGSTCRILQDDLDENHLELDDVHDNEVFYAEGEVIQYKCKNGFYYHGQPTGKCSEQKMSYPKCTESSMRLE
ncbi:complement factor H isoform X4 [Bufo bufo]|uniref:complement factor H isoform X4 n=1 Tax=Bufo bufo TaxID=8384 RepID=UPI001ABE1B11|nr:complement factor H isoform X4 [Bufo bufo]